MCHSSATSYADLMTEESYLFDEETFVDSRRPGNVTESRKPEMEGVPPFATLDMHQLRTERSTYTDASTENSHILGARSFDSALPHASSLSSSSVVPYADLVLENLLTPRRTFECPVCRKEAVDRSTFKKHYTCHSGEKPYFCPESSTTFFRAVKGSPSIVVDSSTMTITGKRDFQRHYMTHTGEKPHACPFCMHRSVRKSDMLLHMSRRHGCNL
ncbi:hypothetical protein HAZT_HAZT004251 [Hyalella azteca]|uniref:C2H2-type domain-containing protein n=1 Tax=Hyalella azteca TaxID=294128 RepID=A0A6A0GS87_HYAAZ|nr:hypothetical protein HAZT_HAZT004251 [Hyalella azteca]